MERWLLAAVANGVVALTYASISMHILRGTHRSGSFRDNPLATATGLIFASCAVGHVGHVSHLLDPATQAAGAQIYDWHVIVIDAITAAIGIRYWLLRSRFPALLKGVELFEDLSKRRTQALTIHDQVVQHLAVAKLALELGENDKALTALDHGLESAKGIVTGLIDHDTLSSAKMEQGGLRRHPR